MSKLILPSAELSFDYKYKKESKKRYNPSSEPKLLMAENSFYDADFGKKHHLRSVTRIIRDSAWKYSS